MEIDWVKEFPGAITVCNPEGIILYMNDQSGKTFESDGGLKLIGKNALNCHPPAARKKMLALLRSGEKNVYQITKMGVKKMIYQSPWYENGEYKGFVEISLVIPEDMPTFNRGG